MIGFKGSMKNIYIDEILHPVTEVFLNDCYFFNNVDDKKVLLAAGKKNSRQINLSLKKKFDSINLSYKKVLKEFVFDDKSYEAGQKVNIDIFDNVEYLDVVSTCSKGKGFAGVVKAYGFAGGPKSHGSSKFHRRPGSLMLSRAEGKVPKGKKMPGVIGARKVTVQNVKILHRDYENNILLLKGSLPGNRMGTLFLSSAVRKKKC